MARHSSALLAWSKLAKRASVERAVLTARCVGIVWLALWKVFSKVDNGIFQLSPALGIVTPPPYRTGREGVSWYRVLHVILQDRPVRCWNMPRAVRTRKSLK